VLLLVLAHMAYLLGRPTYSMLEDLNRLNAAELFFLSFLFYQSTALNSRAEDGNQIPEVRS